jgi:adenosylcobinamide kinase / adenosylcobinamide-phosphate guanylyltransferase
MSLVLLTGPVRSGKSRAAEHLAASRDRAVVVAVAGWEGDAEMRRRISAHIADRPTEWETLAATPDPGWLDGVPVGSVLVLECLATLVGTVAHEAAGESEVTTAREESDAEARVDALVTALVERAGDTIVVTNEAGWGVVPASASGRLFRDLLGRANRALVAASDAAYLVVDGRFLELGALPFSPEWPT